MKSEFYLLVIKEIKVSFFRDLIVHIMILNALKVID